MRSLVWIVAGVFALDVLLVAWLSFVDAIRHGRATRAGRDHSDAIDVGPSAGVITLPSALGAARTSGVRRGFRRASFAAAAIALSLLAAAQLRGDLPPTVAAWTDRLDGTALAPRVEQHRAASTTSRSQEGERAEAAPSDGSVGSITSTDGDLHDGVTSPASIAARPRSAARIVIVWTPVPGAVEYRVQRSPGAVAEWATIASIASDSTTFTDTGLEPETTYSYRVVTFTEEGATPPSDVATVTTPAEPPAATTLTGSSSGTTASLSWTAVDGATAYRIERSLDGSEWLGLVTTSADTLGYEDVGLTVGATYDYRVIAIGEGGEAPASNVVPLTIEDGGSSPTSGDSDGGAVSPPGGADAVSPTDGADAVSPTDDADAVSPADDADAVPTDDADAVTPTDDADALSPSPEASPVES